MYFVRDIFCGCDMSLRDEIKEFISYRNGMKWSYIAFEQRENISHERKRIYRQNDRHLDYTVFIVRMFAIQGIKCRGDSRIARGTFVNVPYKFFALNLTKLYFKKWLHLNRLSRT